MPTLWPTARALLLGIALVVAASKALAADRFASTSGSDTANACLLSTSPCRTIGHAVTQAASGDTIKLAEGTYKESSLTIPGAVTLTLSGGWSSDFAAQGASPTKTKLDAGFQGPALVVTAAGTTVDVTLETVTITKGSPGVLASSSGTGSLTLTVDNALFRRNRNTGSDGGAIAVTSADTSSADVTLTNSTLKANQTPYRGAGLDAVSSGSSALSVSVGKTTFISNWAHNGGGAMGALQLDTSSIAVDVDASVFTQNRGSHPSNPYSAGGGAIVFIGDAAPVLTLTNSSFSRNKARDGGAVRILGTDVSASVVNCSISKNSAIGFESASTFGGGIYMSASGALALVNTVLWGNQADHGADLVAIDAPDAALTVDFDHCVRGVLSNSYPTYGALATFNDLGGNLDDIDPGLSRDFHLKADSPAIDAGTCTGAPTTDFEGDTRPSGAGCDIGADEFTP